MKQRSGPEQPAPAPERPAPGPERPAGADRSGLPELAAPAAGASRSGWPEQQLRLSTIASGLRGTLLRNFVRACAALCAALHSRSGAQGVRVNTVTPGMIATGFHDTFTADEVRKNVAAATQLKREGRADECASVIAFLCSEDASYMTGTALDINGGLAFS